MSKKKKKKNNLSHYILSNLLSTLKDSRKNAMTVALIKDDILIKNKNEIISNIIRTFPPMERKLFGYQFPKNAEELGKCNKIFFRPKSLESEMQWLIHQFKTNKNSLKTFISMKEKIEKLFLQGNFYDVENLLSILKDKIGVSIWYYEMLILTYIYQDKQSSVYRLLTEINEKKDKKGVTGFVPFLLFYIHKRSERKLPAIQYDMDLYSRYKRNSTAFQKDRYNYYLFKLNYYKNIDVDDFSTVLYFDETNALVDRYLCFLNVLRILFTPNNQPSQVKYAKIGTGLYNTLHDNTLLPYVAYLSKNIPDIYYNSEFIQILDNYYTGSYDNVIKLCQKYILSNPSHFDVIKIYCRSLIFLNNGYIPPIKTIKDSPINEISQYVYKIMSLDNSQDTIYELYQINKNLYSFRISADIDAFINEEKNVHTCSLKQTSILCFDPIFRYTFNDISERLNYLEFGVQRFPDSVAIKYQRDKIKGIVTENTRIVAYIRDVDNAKIYFAQEKYHKCLDIMLNVYEDNKDVVPIVQNSINYQYMSLVKLEDFSKATTLYVDSFLRKGAFVSKIDTDELLSILKKKKFGGIRYSLDFLNFVFLSAKAETDKSFVLEQYCKYKNVKIPSELEKNIENKDKSKVELFFSMLCFGDTLRHFKAIKSTKELFEERLRLAQYLSAMNTDKKHSYDEQIRQLTEALVVYKGINKVDESKIFANENAILRYELPNIQPLFEQFERQFQIVNGSNFRLYVIDKTKDDKELNLLKQDILFTDNAMKEISVQFFDKVMYAFLKSKFGLGTYLSTRIRHGVFETQIQSIFILAKLLLMTDKKQPIQNIYWKNTYGLSTLENGRLNKALEIMSMNINNSIDEFKERVLQIKLREEDLGELNFIVPDDDKCYYMINAYYMTHDFSELCGLLMRNLWEITEKSLSKIRTHINKDLRHTYNQLLDKLEEDVKGIGNDNFQKDFNSKISDTRVEIGSCLSGMERWFYIQKCEFDDFDIKSQIDIVWEITSQMYPNSNSELHVEAQIPTRKIKGIYGVHFIDLLRIFFTNMIKYAKKETERKFTLKITTSIDNIVRFHFVNNINNGAEEKLNQRFHNLLNSYDKLQKEGGSGLVKARKIVKYDFNCIDNEIEIKAENNKCIANIVMDFKNLLV